MSSTENEFGLEVALAASEYIGSRAISHQRYAECRSGLSKPACMEVGMERDNFDCSGLAIRSICDVLGLEVRDWDPTTRHVRDMAPLIESITTQNVQAGDIAVFGPRVKLNSNFRMKPTHVGIVLPKVKIGLCDESRMVHSNVSLKNMVTNGRVRSNGDSLMAFYGVINPIKLAETALPRRARLRQTT